MASIEEKIQHLSLFRVNLYKEGVLWLAYEQSAYYVWLLKGYKPIKKRYKKMDKEVVQVGFPKVDALLENQNISIVTRQDTFIKDDNNIKYYGRCVDDFYIISDDANYLKELISTSKEYLKN
jgi:hypothetical protein